MTNPNIDDGDGVQALDYNQVADRWQYSVREGCAVSVGSGALEADVANGSVIHDGDVVSVAGQTVSLEAADTLPRKDVVYVDGGGTVLVATGVAERAQPPGEVRAGTYRPAPQDLSATAAVVLAEVWVAGDASDITSADIRDRRQFADLSVREVDATSVVQRK